MKHINLLVLAIFFISTNMSAQVILNAYAGEDICGDVTLTLNNSVNLSEDKCEFTTDYSNVQSGANTLSLTSDVFPLSYTSTLDMVRTMRYMDEGFESYAEGIAADFNNDQVISTDDIVSMRRVILGIESNIPHKIKLATVEQVSDPLTSFELDSEHTSLTFDESELEDGVPKEVVLVIVGNFK